MSAKMRGHGPIADPPLATLLFNEVRLAWIWAILRIYLGYQWLIAGWGKLSSSAWMETGAALRGFWTGAVQMPEGGKPVITYDWYRAFLQWLLDGGHYTWFAKLVVYSEIILGLFLILGLLTGFAAFGGAVMNFNFMLAGTASTNPVMFTVAILLLMAWKVSGYVGLDYWVLPAVGTPWRPPQRTQIAEGR